MLPSRGGVIAPFPPRARKRSRPTISVWHRHLERAEFEKFTWHEPSGRIRFKGQRPTEAKRFRERVWPVFWRIRPVWRPTDAWELRRSPVWAVDWDRSIDKAFRIKLARRWLVEHPLQRHWDRVDETIEATRGTRA
jgi:hypothetical protein